MKEGYQNKFLYFGLMPHSSSCLVTSLLKLLLGEEKESHHLWQSFAEKRSSPL